MPTIAEAGFPNAEFDFWVGVLAPAATPRDVVRRLNGEIGKIMQSPELRARLETMGAVPMLMNPEDFDKFLLKEFNTLSEVMRAAGAKPQ